MFLSQAGKLVSQVLCVLDRKVGWVAAAAGVVVVVSSWSLILVFSVLCLTLNSHTC